MPASANDSQQSDITSFFTSLDGSSRCFVGKRQRDNPFDTRAGNSPGFSPVPA
jgi:hypothetical protein